MAFDYNTWASSWTAAYDTWGGSWGLGVPATRLATPGLPTATNTFSPTFGGSGGPRHLAGLYQNRQELMEEHWRRARRMRVIELQQGFRAAADETENAKRQRRRRLVMWMLAMDD